MRHQALAVLVALFSFGCSNELPPKGGTTASATGSSSAPVAEQGGKKMHRGMRGGPLAVMFRAARSVTLDEEQKTKLDAIQKDLHGDGPRDAMKALHADIVAGIKAGKIDTAKIEADQAALDTAVKAHVVKEAEAMNALHAALKPDQRKTLVADVREKNKKRDEKAAKWKDKADEGKGPKNHFGHFTKDLDLDDAQQKKIDAIIAKQPAPVPPDFEAMKKRWETLLTEFEKDTFDAKKLDLSNPMPAMGGFMKPAVLAEIVPILKPEQREKLAEKMSKGPGIGKPKGPPKPAADDDEDDD